MAVEVSTDAREREVLDAVPKELFIGGSWREARGGARLGVEDPATGEQLVEVADASPEDALARWRRRRARRPSGRRARRATAARSCARRTRRSSRAADELALLMTLEMGKSVTESKAEIAYAAEFFRWFSEEAVRIHGRYMVNTTGKGRILTMRQPVGPCVFVTPWNFPTAMGTRKIAPAVAAGCTMVVKPAQQTPLSMLALAQILEESGLPAGVLNVITAKRSARCHRTAAEGPAHAQAVVHRLDRGRQAADRAVRRAGPADVDGARRQRAVPRLRGRRPRRRGRGRDAREDAQRRRGLHGREPLPRARVARRGVLPAARRADARAEGRPRDRAGRRRGPVDRRHPAREGRRSSSATRCSAARRCSPADSPARAPATSTSRRCSPPCPTTRGC